MPARFSAYPPDSPALVRLLDDGMSYRIGRSPDCELCVEHFSVSRFHAELRRSNTGSWSMHDIGSKNGLRVDGHLVQHATLDRATWFAVGDVYCWFELLDHAGADSARAQIERRRSTSRSLSAQLGSGGFATLIPRTLDVILELSGLERGFVLYAPGGQPLRVHAARGLEPGEFSTTAFSGSVSAVERALAERAHVVCCDTTDSPWLGARPSVRLGGIRALVCVPLQMRGDAMGVVYADSRKPGPPITDLDMELIGTVAEHASAALAARQLQGDVDDFLRAAADAGLDAPRWDELRYPRSD